MDVLTHSPVIADSGDEPDLPALVESARAGRSASLDGLLARIHQRVRRWAARYTDDADTADDVAQEVLIRVERQIGTYRGGSRFSTWLFAVTRNVALTHRRKELRRSALLQREVARSGPAESPAERDPDAAALMKLVLREFDALTGKQRIIFELADIHGMHPAEIARELGMEPVTVRAHLCKARKTIRERMLQHHERMLEEYRS
jgi:RNA polymerase sigma-70 factor (ECF subfamily)